jgi:hypothetical protein
MQIVIDIDERRFKGILRISTVQLRGRTPTLEQVIAKGIPLPKGHGNLIQREDAETIFKNARKALLEQSRKEQIKDLQTREMMLLNAEQFIHLIHPIIEADHDSGS